VKERGLGQTQGLGGTHKEVFGMDDEVCVVEAKFGLEVVPRLAHISDDGLHIMEIDIITLVATI
jgi:hypothetical protein